ALMYIAIIACLANMMIVPFNALQSAFVSLYYHGDASILSIMGIGVSIGSILGGLLYPKIVDRVKIKTMLLTIFPTCSLFYVFSLLCGRIMNYQLMIVAIGLVNFLLGINVGLANCYVSVLLMVKCEQDYLSRVSGFFNAISVMFMPVLSLIVSIVSNYLTIPTIFIISAIIMAIISVITYVDKRLEILNA
ncbi:MAG: hypothetical protein MR210_03995, partial [Erysipelotrichaceae bacterium]|nr:hypothetical protein [Erysipelotrichaceae bacterium]